VELEATEEIFKNSSECATVIPTRFQSPYETYKAVFPKLCVATPWGCTELLQGRRKKTMIKVEKKKNKNCNILLLNSNLSFSLTNFLTNNFNSSNFYFFIITTTHYSQCISQKYIFLKDSSIFIILHFSQFVTWFPKTVLGGGA
jgi:Fe2+ transport system protein B